MHLYLNVVDFTKHISLVIDTLVFDTHTHTHTHKRAHTHTQTHTHNFLFGYLYISSFTRLSYSFDK